MSLRQKQSKFTRHIAQLIAFATDQGYEVTFGEAHRPNWVQKVYFLKRKSKTLNSYHTKRLALDLNLFKNGLYLTETEDYRELGDYWESLSPECIWGGRWGWDGNHFQYGGLRR